MSVRPRHQTRWIPIPRHAAIVHQGHQAGGHLLADTSGKYAGPFSIESASKTVATGLVKQYAAETAVHDHCHFATG